MKKHIAAAMFLFIVIAAFSGTVAAEASLDTYHTDDQGNEITEAQVGDTVEYIAEVQNDGNEVQDATLNITVDSDVYWDNFVEEISFDGGATYVDPAPFVTEVDNLDGTWNYNVALGELDPFQLVILRWQGDMGNAGTSIKEATVYDGTTPMDTSLAVLTVTEPAPPAPANTTTVSAAGTVGMQKTGAPIGLLVMAMLMVAGGLLLPRRK
ncbi:hypothetical protein [Methanobacterium sp.]|uniref:hypothetical protein n=1 Tax=Methanobacterium sp. TaxID=2164 RepID=UPI002AB8D835|nr:hypothetical protein [Methanobacterium sp.]MDY9922963.1 hypothetical protein [Methanobacterium sp.]